MQQRHLRAAGAILLGAALCAPAAYAQSTAAPPAKVETLDRIVAIVNDEVITKYEMDDQKRLVMAQLKREFGRMVVDTTSRVTGKVLNSDDQERINRETAAQVSL